MKPFRIILFLDFCIYIYIKLWRCLRILQPILLWNYSNCKNVSMPSRWSAWEMGTSLTSTTVHIWSIYVFASKVICLDSSHLVWCIQSGDFLPSSWMSLPPLYWFQPLSFNATSGFFSLIRCQQLFISFFNTDNGTSNIPYFKHFVTSGKIGTFTSTLLCLAVFHEPFG